MADINLSPYTAEQQAMDRRRKMAEAMQQQAMNPMEMPTMPGVQISPAAGLAKMLQAYVAKRNFSRADQEQKDYENRVSEDQARLFRNMGKTETMPGDIIKPAQEAQYPTNENIIPSGEYGGKRLDAVDISSGAMPIAAVPEERGPSRQVPYLSADLLNPTNPNAMKTGQGKQMLAQYLMQQEAQKQAAAQAELAASQQIHAFNPEQNVGTFSGGRFNTLIQGQPKPMTEAQQLEAELKQYATEVEADKALDVNRIVRPFQRLPKGVPIGAKRTGGKTPDGKEVFELNGKKYVGE